MIALVALTAALPLAGLIAVLLRATARGAGAAAVASGAASLTASIVVLVRVLADGPVRAGQDFVYLDSLGAYFLFTVAIVVFLASLGSAAYLRSAQDDGSLSVFQIRLYFAFFALFAALMLGSLTTGNLGLLFVLIEASTLASAALVGLEASSQALEAAWKYVIISSFGVTMALVGTVFLFYSGTALQLTSNLRLSWPFLFQHADALSHPSLRLAFLLAVIGYGTKVGLAPMHTWLPDAHSEAPSPASAMLSAALLTTGMYAIIRFLAIARAGLGPSYPQHTMLVFGFLSVLIGALFMVRRGSYKRLFAYSSVEHMGIIAVALGFGGTLGLYGALLHVLNHAIGKATLFLGSGDILLAYRTRQVKQVRGVLQALPLTGVVLLLATFAILGSPPFGLFLSELTIVRAGFAGASPVLPAFLLLLLVVAFIGFARSTTGMATGTPGPGAVVAPYPLASSRILAAVPLVVGMAALLVLGVWIPGGLDAAIRDSIGALT